MTWGNTVIVWLKRATGIGYKQFPPLEKTPEFQERQKDTEKMSKIAKEICDLERAIRYGRYGHSS